MATVKYPCTCKSEFQDKLYGKGIRIFNGKKEGKDGWRCTVCCKEIGPVKENK